MSIFLWDSEPSKIYVWSNEVSAVYVWDTQIYPAGWKPWANTLAYYPLETDTKDYSWNNRNLTNSWITFDGGVW
jgi:hypothetical protein